MPETAVIETIDKGTNCKGCMFIKYCRWGNQTALFDILTNYLGLESCVKPENNVKYQLKENE